MTIKELQEIALHCAKGTVPATYANQNVDMDSAFLDGLKELAGSVNQFMKNRYDIYDIVIKTADEIMPKKVIDAIGMFAEVQSVPQGQKAIFKRRLGKMRAKKFLTQVGLSGVYETFRLDSDTFELAGHAVGGGATIDFERMLDGAETMAEVMQVLTEGLTDAVFYEVHKALRAAVNASARPEFVGAMGPDAIVSGIANTTNGIYHPQDIDAIHNTGYINIFRGTPVVQIPQSFIDESNTKTWIDPQLAYILPTGGEKVVKVVLEGNTQINDFKNRDNSLEVYAYKKMGCAILAHHNWGIYQNTGITQTFENPYNF